MTNEQIVTTLRDRLNAVSTEISARLGARRPSERDFLINHGATNALMAEQQFLAGIIAELDREAAPNELIQREIAMILDDMRTDAESQREYSIGALSALLWVLGGGDMMRTACFEQACAAWDAMRAGGEVAP